MSLMLSQDAPADSLLERDPLALLLAMLLDQQVPMERAFAAPYELKQRLGHDLDAHELADYEPDALADLFARPPALHRYPKAMAGRVQDLCRAVVEHYDGDVTGLWRDVSRRIGAVRPAGRVTWLRHVQSADLRGASRQTA